MLLPGPLILNKTATIPLLSKLLVGEVIEKIEIGIYMIWIRLIND